MNALERISEERRRQVEKEGYSHEHDDRHVDNELATFAAHYALPSNHIDGVLVPSMSLVPKGWETKKSPSDGMGRYAFGVIIHHSVERRGELIDRRIGHLVKAGALVVAEIERLERLKEKLKTAYLKCRVCGCTVGSACEGGCHWVEEDLCSSCVEKSDEEKS